jgi:hypothetical protein
VGVADGGVEVGQEAVAVPEEQGADLRRVAHDAE